jgi:AcrR family transcriptional regulator
VPKDDVADIPKRDAAATRRRLLAAATEEFVVHGFAGARVDRIATAARANKSQLYATFGSKAGLFDAVLTDNVDRLVDAAPLDADDLPAYALSLYDAYLEQPEMVRLAAWERLERRPAGVLFGDGEPVDQGKLQAIADAQAAGRVTSAMAPEDVHSLVIAMAATWSATSITTAADRDDSDAVHDRRRQALADAVRGAFAA